METIHYTKRNPPPKSPRLEYGPGRTRQSEAAACDINNIVERYHKTGVLPVVNRQMWFMDVSEVGDYRSALEQVERGEKAFMQLPPKVRARFMNDPAEFLDFTSDPANREEMVEMGLIEDVSGVPPEKPAEPDKVETPPADGPPEPSE